MLSFKLGDLVTLHEDHKHSLQFRKIQYGNNYIVCEIISSKDGFGEDITMLRNSGTMEPLYGRWAMSYFKSAHPLVKQQDVVNYPKHYSLFPEHNIEAKDVVKLWLERWEMEAKTEISFYQAACLKEMLCYILRSPLKNEMEDLEKAQWYLNEIIKEAKENVK